MGRRKPWHEDDGIWAALGPVLFDGDRTNEAGREVKDIIRLVGLKAPVAVLDLCCGVGRHSVELARRGFTVTGVDRSREYLDEAALAAESAGVDVELIEADMREFSRPLAFDAALNLWTSFGYFEDIADDRKVLQNIFESLRPGGTLVMTLMGKEVLARIFKEEFREDRGGRVIVQKCRIERDWSWIESTWNITGPCGTDTIMLSHRLYSAVELESLASSCGFEQVRAYGNLAGDPYDHRAERLVLVAMKNPDQPPGTA